MPTFGSFGTPSLGMSSTGSVSIEDPVLIGTYEVHQGSNIVNLVETVIADPSSGTGANVSGGFLQVVLQSCSYTNVTASGNTTIKSSSGKLYGIKNLSGSAQTVTITLYDDSSGTSGNQLTASLTLGAGQTILEPAGGTGFITGCVASLSGAPDVGIQVLWL